VSTVYEQLNPPDSATSGDRWVDTHDNNKIWLIHTTYDLSASYASLTIPAASRPGSVALVITAAAAGNAGRNINVTITDAGASGTSSLAKSGSGTRADPYVYAFTTYQDDNSNDRLIAVLAASGYTDITITGSDATSADCADIDDDLETDVLDDYCYAYSIVFRYLTTPAELSSTSSEIDASIPTNVMEALSKALASEMASMMEGRPMAASEGRWAAEFENEMTRALDNLAYNGIPGQRRVR